MTEGAVYIPDDDIVPKLADHVTAVFDAFKTVAVNVVVALDRILVEVGETLT